MIVKGKVDNFSGFLYDLTNHICKNEPKSCSCKIKAATGLASFYNNPIYKKKFKLDQKINEAFLIKRLGCY